MKLLWNLLSGECLQVLHEHTSWVTSVLFSSDGQFLVSGSDDRTIKLWDVATGRCIRTLMVDRLFDILPSPEARDSQTSLFGFLLLSTCLQGFTPFWSYSRSTD
ncbi:MAG: hypothetical protein KA714_11825 [Limnoraphis sp. WC205]|nr:hypothetical protein [Limnoraphis sp. WC205]